MLQVVQALHRFFESLYISRTECLPLYLFITQRLHCLCFFFYFLCLNFKLFSSFQEFFVVDNAYDNVSLLQNQLTLEDYPRWFTL